MRNTYWFAVDYNGTGHLFIKGRIHTRKVEHKAACVVIGLALGCMSSFLGIGGGPINLVVLYYFFSMDTKTAAANSLYIIFFSQLVNLITTVLSGAPSIRPLVLVLMVAGGIGGGILGRSLNKRLDERAVERLFIGMMAVIIGISIFNTIRYSGSFS